MDSVLRQEAPFPQELADLVARTRFRPGYRVWLSDGYDRGQGSRGLTLVVQTAEVDTYHPEVSRPVHHPFIVPAASYNRRSWQRWLFEQLRLVSGHEDAEWFRLAGDDGSEHRPYAPLHGPGWDPYLVAELAGDEDRRTSFRGDLNPGRPLTAVVIPLAGGLQRFPRRVVDVPDDLGAGRGPAALFVAAEVFSGEDRQPPGLRPG